MIWVWILASIILTLFWLRGKRISFENYIWVLLPVDMYGVNVAGVVLKPYMLFCIVLLLKDLSILDAKNFIGSKEGTGIIGILLAGLAVNTLNGGGEGSINTALLSLFTLFCAFIYASANNDKKNEIYDAIVATSIGYGSVFIIAYILTMRGIELPGVSTTDRMEPGIMMNFSNMYEGNFSSIYRLRGFCIDPNASVIFFISALVVNIMFFCSKKKENVFRHVLSTLILLTCIVLTYSRTGLIATVAVFFISLYVNKRKNRNAIVFIAIIAAILYTAYSFVSKDVLDENIILLYKNRSGFNDDYGRGIIWKEAISIWTQKGLLFGIGFGEMQNYTVMERACHNTWLEWFSACGLLIGGAIIIFFGGLLIKSFRKTISETDCPALGWATVGLFGAVICLSSIDNVTNCFLWIYTAILIKEINSEKLPTEGKQNSVALSDVDKFVRSN